MPFCPHCKDEYVAGIKLCVECQLELVDQLPEEVHPNIKWAPLHPLPGPVYGEMVKEALEREGIPCLIQKDFLTSAYGAQGTGAGGLETILLVPEDRVSESEAILSQMLDHI
ncbi:MAG TPA: DUF2007 domain-containing protein [bacterium]|jgi:hypothetical protein